MISKLEVYCVVFLSIIMKPVTLLYDDLCKTFAHVHGSTRFSVVSLTSTVVAQN